MDQLRAAQKPRKRTDDQHCAQCGEGPAPVRIDPVAEESQPQNDQNSAQQGKRSRYPAAQHPDRRHGHHDEGHPNANPSVVRNQQTQSQREAASGKIHGRVRRDHIDVDFLEMLPVGRRRIGQAPGQKRLRLKDETVLIVIDRKGCAQPRQEGRPEAKGQKTDESDRGEWTLRQPGPPALEPREATLGQTRHRKGHDQDHREQGYVRCHHRVDYARRAFHPWLGCVLSRHRRIDPQNRLAGSVTRKAIRQSRPRHPSLS